jgi:hypothetical protein
MQQRIQVLGQIILKVCFIDDFADQTIGVTTTNLSNLGAQLVMV